MCSNGSHEEILCMAGGKKDKGTSRPESNSMSQNLARMSARMDFSGIAQVPMAKLIAPIKRKLPAADSTNRRKCPSDAGRRTGKRSEMRMAVGAVRRIKRKADSPMARVSHIHCTETGLS